jgi:hypothetical protein
MALSATAAGTMLVGLPPVLLLQRGMLYAQLHAAARTDVKTGLLNAGTWEREAATELAENTPARPTSDGAAGGHRPLQAGQRHPRAPRRR